MTQRMVGYAQVSYARDDIATQRSALLTLGADEHDVHLDSTRVGSTTRPALRDALRRCRAGDILVTTTLDRLVCSPSELRDIVEILDGRGVRLAVGSTIYDPTDSRRQHLFDVVAQHPHPSSVTADPTAGPPSPSGYSSHRRRSRSPQLTTSQEADLVHQHRTSGESPTDLAASFGIGRSTVYRILARARHRRDETRAQEK